MNHIRLSILCLFAFIPACTQTSPTDALDPDRLLHMAGEEAGQIPSPRERLTRQLNIADREIRFGRPGDARATLRDARKTLESAGAISAAGAKGAGGAEPAGGAAAGNAPAQTPLTNHERLAGWISLSELARGAEDKPFANSALDRATADLMALNPVNERCQYVLGVARETRELRGDKEAAGLIAQAGEWAMEIPDQPMRRQAYVAFAMEIFRCNDYDAARGVLRRDQDAAWRSDTLTAMADRARYQAAMTPMAWRRATDNISGPMAEARITDAPAPESFPTTFGKSLDFKSNYYRQGR